MLDCVMGIDVGTTSSRAAIYQMDGQMVAEGRAPHFAHHPAPGWAEQPADDWWRSVCAAVQSAFSRFPFPHESVRGVAVTSMRQSFVALDWALQPLRPGILWYDTRSAPQADWVREHIGARSVYETTGSPPGRRAIYKVIWLKQNEPEIYKRIHRIVFIPDYIQYKLTGILATTPGVSMTSGCLNAASPLEWAAEFITACGVDPGIWIPTILPAGEIVGQVTKAAALETGLLIGTPIVLAAGDQSCGNLGVGICRPGMLGINGGTSCALQTPSERLPIDANMSCFVDFSPTGCYIAENGITSGTAALTEWFRDQFCLPDVAFPSGGGEDWEALYNLASQAPAGNMGLMLVPYLRGANGPSWDQRARGVLVGLTTDHGYKHMVRALFEGLAYESRKILENIQICTGVKIDSIRTYGGASISKVWNQIFADVLNQSIEVTRDRSPVSLGTAITAGFGVGLFPNPGEAVTQMVRVEQRYEPNEGNASLYDQLFNNIYVNIYHPLSGYIQEAARLTSTTEYSNLAKET